MQGGEQYLDLAPKLALTTLCVCVYCTRCTRVHVHDGKGRHVG